MGWTECQTLIGGPPKYEREIDERGARRCRSRSAEPVSGLFCQAARAAGLGALVQAAELHGPMPAHPGGWLDRDSDVPVSQKPDPEPVGDPLAVRGLASARNVR